VTESARLLAKARAELDSAEEVENERIQMLKQQIASGNYEIPVDELAKRLLAKRSLFGE
jgi:flagellar biosynthesis anti-sigma factor FlgM